MIFMISGEDVNAFYTSVIQSVTVLSSHHLRLAIALQQLLAMVFSLLSALFFWGVEQYVDGIQAIHRTRVTRVQSL